MKFKIVIKNYESEYSGSKYGIRFEGVMEVLDGAGEILLAYLKNNKTTFFNAEHYAKWLKYEWDGGFLRQFDFNEIITAKDIANLFMNFEPDRIYLEVIEDG